MLRSRSSLFAARPAPARADSICLALYRDTPRIKSSNDSDYADELFIKKDKDGKIANTVKFKDVRQLMRRGAKEAFAKLEFEGNDGKNYSAKWSVRFNRNGNIDAEKQELLNKLQELAAYYSSKQWRQDFDDDSAGKIPNNLKRGVLSEDAVYNLLADITDLKEQLKALADK